MKKLITYILLIISLTTQITLASNGATEVDDINTNESIKHNLMEQLIPNQDKLFKGSKKLDQDLNQEITENEQIFRLAEGDLEKEILPRVFQIGFFLSGTVFMIILIYAGIKLIANQDNEESLTKTKNLIINTLMGVAFIGAAFAVITGIISYFDLIR